MTLDHDIAIVGYGPVGQTAAILLGLRGHRVGVYERWPERYARPRAVHYDDEIARAFQRLGIDRQLATITEPANTYEWQNAAGERLLLLDRTGEGPSGWPAATMFTQPQLEQLLDTTAASLSSVEVHRGWQVEDLDEQDSHVGLSLRATKGQGSQDNGARRRVTAAWVIGCDGANSLVRDRLGTPVTDLGFAYDWLIADTIPHEKSLLAGVNLQICDPQRPTTLVSGGPGRRRWEWMLLPGETAAELEREQTVWGLLERSGVGPDDVALERHTVYTFRARWAESWRRGRLLLAGDAAHQMPPFAGQGLCSGIRDAVALAWRLDLLLRGRAGEEILESYTSERRGHVQHAIAISVELGKVICIADEAEAAARDATLLALAADPEAPSIAPPVAGLGPGLHDSAPEGLPGGGGSLFPQGRDSAGERVEDALPAGFAVYRLGGDPRELLVPADANWLDDLGSSFVTLPAPPSVDPLYSHWFASNQCTLALVRPDFYVFGTASTAAEAAALVGRLRAALEPADPTKESNAT